MGSRQRMPSLCKGHSSGKRACNPPTHSLPYPLSKMSIGASPSKCGASGPKEEQRPSGYSFCTDHGLLVQSVGGSKCLWLSWLISAHSPWSVQTWHIRHHFPSGEPFPLLHHIKLLGKSGRDGVTCLLLTFALDLLKECCSLTFPGMLILLPTFPGGTNNHVHPFPFSLTSRHRNGINMSTRTTDIASSDSQEDGRREVLHIPVLETCPLSTPSISCID